MVIGSGLGYLIGVGNSTEPTMESMEVGKESMISETEDSMESNMESEKETMKSGEEMGTKTKIDPRMGEEKESMMSEKMEG